MNKFYDTLTNTRGDVLPNYRAQVVNPNGTLVDIFADRSKTPFTDANGGTVNYATADSEGLVEFYWEAATGQIFQMLDPAGDLVKSIEGFADNYVLDNFSGSLTIDQVVDLGDELLDLNNGLAARPTTADLASTDPGKGASLVNWLEITAAEWFASQPINVKAYGAKGDGVTDDTAAIQAAADTGKNLFFPAGAYKISSAILLKAGQIVMGVGTAKYASTYYSKIQNDEVGGGCFWYEGEATTAQRRMPRLFDLSLQADYPVRFNDESTATISAGSLVPHGMNGGVVRCDIRARVAGTGIGISITKCFNCFITLNDVERFSVNILLNGTDLSHLSHNRSILAYDYHILETSTSTFGSQNEIHHNDILLGGSTDCIFIKSFGIHARIYDNYLEHREDGGTYPASIKGFIDVSSVDAPTYGGNAVATHRFTAIVRDNRIDGHVYADEFVYRYEPRLFAEIRDVGTAGPNPTAPTLLLCDSSGANVDELPILYNTQNPSQFEFSGAKFGKWNGFKSNTEHSLKVDGANLYMTGYANLVQNNIFQSLRINGRNIVLKAGLNRTAPLFIAIPGLLDMVDPGRTFVVNVMAKCSGSEQLRFGTLADGVAGTLNTTDTLTDDFRLYSREVTFSSTPSSEAGVTLRPAGSGNTGADIEIAYIEVKPKYAREYPVTTYTAPVALDLGASAGFVDVLARNDAGTFTSRKRYAIVYGELIEIASSETDGATISVSATLSGTTVTATVTGSAGSKNLAIGHNLS